MPRSEKLPDFRKQKLIDLGTDTFADTLLYIALRSDGADDLIEQLIPHQEEIESLTRVSHEFFIPRF
ncbi:MAG: hypothetical protein CSA20_07730 [Deltaproteobacteria bacterium]|nr:MAG: hypothetical protein CSA20_07730 [Deltaproteobacteria bacterium]